MVKLHTKAPAKINLTLDVLSRRNDGYHNLSTIMHEIPRVDDIDIYLGQGKGVRAKTNFAFIRGDKNLASRACKLFFDELTTIGYDYEKVPGVFIDIHKRIPVGAGLGGGSADAAAVLNVLNEHFRFPFSLEKLMAIGAQLGADVPFCIHGGCALCEGIGEMITPQKTLPHCFIVMAKPTASISTADIFSLYRTDKSRMRPDTAGALSALEAGDLGGVSRRVYNVLQEYAERGVKDIFNIHDILLRQGALGASMSGSGSSVFGLFDERETAETCYAALKTNYVDVYLLEVGA